jgi:hypothetical protein
MVPRIWFLKKKLGGGVWILFFSYGFFLDLRRAMILLTSKFWHYLGWASFLVS